jgi:hypothetical protein
MSAGSENLALTESGKVVRYGIYSSRDAAKAAAQRPREGVE